MKTIYLLGATGSIGEQTLDIIRAYPDDFKLIAISGYSNFHRICEITREFQPRMVVVKDEADKKRFSQMFPEVLVKYGREGLKQLATFQPQDHSAYLVNALVGMVGLEPTIEAIKIERDILLANKETLVVGGHLIRQLRKKYACQLYPIDSEHNALWQLLKNEKKAGIKRLIITASGGSFRDLSREELKHVSLRDALNHPNWSMGSKITIDSATMMNKGFEVIEACYLFDLELDQVDTVIHKESMIHALVEYVDGTVLAHLANPDMHMPIAYAMHYPSRMPSLIKPFDLMAINHLSFEPMDFKRYPCLKLALDAYRTGGSMRVVLNAANEAAVSLFLKGQISFLDIETIIEDAMHQHKVVKNPSLDDVYRIDQEIKDKIFLAYSEE